MGLQWFNDHQGRTCVLPCKTVKQLNFDWFWQKKIDFFDFDIGKFWIWLIVNIWIWMECLTHQLLAPGNFTAWIFYFFIILTFVTIYIYCIYNLVHAVTRSARFFVSSFDNDDHCVCIEQNRTENVRWYYKYAGKGELLSLVKKLTLSVFSVFCS